MSEVIHYLKAWPEHFQAVKAGLKTAEFRRDDRGFLPGHFLVLEEFDPTDGRYTGQTAVVKVTHCTRDAAYGIPRGYAMLSITNPVALGYDPDLVSPEPAGRRGRFQKWKGSR